MSSQGHYLAKKAFAVFGTSSEQLESRGIRIDTLPAFARGENNRALKSWSSAEMPAVGERIGFLKKPRQPVAMSVFVTKGGVLKSTLTLNIARTAALHNIRTCVIGLDMQGDVTNALSGEDAFDEETSLSEALDKLSGVKGLANVFSGECSLDDVIKPTDLPSLFYIPETPELVALDQSLVNKNRREYWLRDHVVAPLKREFDLIIMDCSPNWNRLITNSLIACDVLVSPLECKINNFRNLKLFQALIQEFKSDMQATFKHVYVPTRLAPQRKLSREIFDYYHANIEGCLSDAVRETTQGEESVAMRTSMMEYAPSSQAADEMRDLVRELWDLALAKSSSTANAKEPGSSSRERAHETNF